MKSERIHRRMLPTVVGSILICLCGCAPRHSHSSKRNGPAAVANKNHATGSKGPNSRAGSSAFSGVSPAAAHTSRNGGLISAAAFGASNVNNLGDVPNDVPPATAINTEGGRLLVGYLKGTFSGESVVDAVFDTEKLVPYRLAEISAAILKLRSAGQFTAQDEDKVQMLETALNKRLIGTIEYHDTLDRWIKYSVAAAISIPATIYAPEIIGAGKGLLESPVITAPKSWIVRAYEGTLALFRRFGRSKGAEAAGEAAAGEVATEATAVAEQRAAEQAAAEGLKPGEVREDLSGTVGEGGPTEEEFPTVAGAKTESAAQAGQGAEPAAQEEAAAESESAAAAKSEKPGLYARIVGSYKTRFGRVTPEQVVIRDINRALSSPELARGFEVTAIPEEQLDQAKALTFSRTGIPGFAMNQGEGSRFLTVRVATGAGYKYFYVNGRAIEILTESGEKQIVRGPTIIKIAADRMKGWRDDTAGFFSRVGGRTKNLALQAKDAAFNNRVSQWLLSQRGKQIIQQSVVGGATGMLTLWALSPINTRYLTVNEYLRALSKEGINLNDFPDELRTELQQEAKVPNKVALPTH